MSCITKKEGFGMDSFRVLRLFLLAYLVATLSLYGEMKLPIAANDNWPLFLDRAQCAAMCGLTLSTFDSWVRKSILPKPLEGTRRWSRIEVEQAARGSTATAATAASPFEQWKASHAH
jgi:predicted DNA-binding transcriptional regulator AlpA